MSYAAAGQQEVQMQTDDHARRPASATGSALLQCPFCAISREPSGAIAAMALLKDDRWVPVCARHAFLLSRAEYTGWSGHYPRDPVKVRSLDAPNDGSSEAANPKRTP